MAAISEVDVTCRLLDLCEEHGLFPTERGLPHPDEDLIECRGIDSMGVVYLQSLIEEEYAVAIPLPILATELRSIRSVAVYIANSLTAREASNSSPYWSDMNTIGSLSS